MTRKQAWLVAIVAMMTTLVSYIDRQTLSALAPSLTTDLDMNEFRFGVASAMFSVAYLVSTPLAGWWLDRIGARRGLVRSVAVWSVVAALHAVVPGFAGLLALRIALGFAEGPGFPGAAQSIQRVLPPASRERGFGVLFLGSSVGSMIAPQLATSMQRLFGSWRGAFVATSAIGLAWIPIWWLVTRRREVRAQLDVPAPTDAADGPAPSLLELIRNPSMIRALIAIIASAPMLGFVLAWGSKYLVGAQGVPKLDVGHYLWLPPLVFDVGAVAFGDLAARRRAGSGARDGSSPRLLFAIATVLGTSLALLAFADTPWRAMAIAAVALFGAGGLYTLATADLLGRMPGAGIARAGGVLACAQSLALVIMNPLVGAAVDHAHNYVGVTIALGAWVVPGSLVWLVWRPTYNRSA